MATLSTRKWISFFQDAGIQDHALAARYAAIFVDNEIHSSMLKELDMELLRVMGISKVGHVLGILKHAKHVHDTQLFADSQPSPASGNQSSGTSSPIVVKDNIRNSIKKVKPTVTRGVVASTTSKSPRSKVTERLGSVAVPVGSQSRPSSTIRLATSPNVSNVYRTVTKPEASRSVLSKTHVEPKIKVTDRLGAKGIAETAKRKKITFSSEEVAEETPSVKKVRRVLPEHEGGYSISLPTGTTPRSREILSKMGPRQTGTVFDRLGEAAVSSTTEVEEPTITITGFGTQIVKSGVSVFSRLGGKGDSSPSTSTPQQPAVHGVKARLGQQVTPNKSVVNSPTFKKRFTSETFTTSHDANKFKPQVTNNFNQVQYAGVLKKPTPNVQSRLGNKPQVIKSAANSTTVSKNSSAGILGNPTNAMKLSAKDRLDLSKASSKVGRQTRARKFIVTNKKTGVKTIVYKMVDDDDDNATHAGKVKSNTVTGPSFGRQAYNPY